MLPKWGFGTFSHQRTKKFCNNFCVRAVNTRASSQQEEDRPRTDLQNKGLKLPGMPALSFAAGPQAQSACAGWGENRSYFWMYFHAIQKIQSFVVWTLVKTDFFSLNHTSFLQQPIHFSCITIFGRPVFPLYYLCNDSVHTCYSKVSTEDAVVLALYSAYTAQQYDSLLRLSMLFSILFQSPSDTIWIENAGKVVKETVNITIPGQRIQLKKKQVFT